MSKKKDRKKATASNKKLSLSQKELQYLRKHANYSVIAAFANGKLLMQ